MAIDMHKIAKALGATYVKLPPYSNVFQLKEIVRRIQKDDAERKK